MKTSQLIDHLTAAATNMMNVFNVVGVLTSEQESDINLYSLLSNAIGNVRDLYNELPEALRTITHEEISATYVHNHKGEDGEINVGECETACYLMHKHAYDLWEDMEKARTKYDLS